ncbi:hypothetical protein [Kutzneria buriramensis]|uniref:NlpC/P60 family protein n=1 Tax=Kutzneria buriramensis TaxID=1045776 RepID=A0A3E0G611_9PSEU|nr:hypothetical protein [Kutzneria buriramensis]REH17419.1 hypothetical protein BCF44_1496 [Kutzneria buriramensis]
MPITRIRRVSAAAMALAALLGSAAVFAAGTASATTAHSQTDCFPPASPGFAMPTITRSQVLARAASWLNQGIIYDQCGSHDGYRTDCSGYVSMAWGLGASPTTDTFGPYGVTVPVSEGDLQPGDALLNPAPLNDGHVVLFDHWDSADHSSYVGYELDGPGNVEHHSIPYPYFGGAGGYNPVRYVNIVDDSTAAPVDRPSAVVTDPITHLPDYFVLSNNGGIYQDEQTATGWTGFSPVPGGTGNTGFVSAPAAVAYNGVVEVFALSNNGSVYQNTRNGSAWTGWDRASLYIGTGNTGFLGTPAAVVDPATGRPILFVRSANSGVYEDALTPTGWSGFAAVAGGTGDNGFTFDPAAVAYGTQKVTVLAASKNGSVYQNTKTGSTWSGWDKASLYTGTGNSGFVGTPAAVVDPGSGLPIFFVRSGNNSLYQNSLTGTGWTGFAAVAGGTGNSGFTTDPGAVAYGNSVDVYAVSSNSSVYHNLKTGSSWSGWTKDSLGAGTGNGGFTGVPAAGVNAGLNLPELFALSTNGSVYVDQNNGAGWNGFGSNALGGGNTGFVAQ